MNVSRPDQLSEELRAAVAGRDLAATDDCLQRMTPGESKRAFLGMTDEGQSQLLAMLPEEQAADLLEAIPEAHAAQIVEQLNSIDAAEILNEVESDEQADILTRLPQATAESILERMEPDEAEDARRLMQYPPNSAGGLMISEYLAYVDSLCVEDVLADLRRHGSEYRGYGVQYAYVVARDGRLVGVLRLRDLLLAEPDVPIASLMIRDPLSVDVNAPLEDLEPFFDRHSLLGVPVVGPSDKLLGVVRRSDIEHAAEERSGRNMLKLTGISGGEELRSMPLRLRSSRRLSWLSINIVLNIVAASVIVMYQDTLTKVIALAVFLPIISDMSGCSGNQAVAVSMRELSLGVVQPSEFFRVLRKEAAVGAINGIALGALLGAIAFFWKGIVALGFIVAVAMTLNTIIAVCIGGTVPLLLRAAGRDPALASGPILTTITDMCGFLLVLSLANAMLPWLT